MVFFKQIVFLLLLLTCCTTQQQEERKFPIIVETGFEKEAKLSLTRYATGYHDIFYLGQSVDTILISPSSKYHFPRPERGDSTYMQKLNSHREYVEKAYEKNIIKYDEKIPVLPSVKDTIGTYQLSIDTTQNILGESYPIFIKNSSEGICIITDMSGYLPITIEARNMEGKWKSITRPLLGCGTGEDLLVLYPDDLIVTQFPIFEGDFHTVLRVRVSDVISNVIEGSINQSQFRR
ncbi:hypothetical protein [Sediminitomix flava]|nr:hypothetical protein [Sediminitomix flava]